MTIICAIHEKGVGTWIGSDTAAFRDGVRRSDCGAKWVVRGARAMASSGSHVIHNLLEENADSLLAVSEATHFQIAKRLWNILTDFGFVPAPCEGERGQIKSWVIYATEHGLYHFTNDGGSYDIGVGEFCADGAGEKFAYGAAHASQYLGARGMVEAGVSAASALSQWCGGAPFIHLLPLSKSEALA